MKRKFQKILRYLPWLLLLFGVDAFFTVLLWIADLDAFYAMSALLLLAVLLMFSAICFVLVHLEEKREQVFLDFLANPDEYHEERLLGVLVPAQGEAVRLLGRCLRDKQNAYIGLLEQMNDYEEYVEAWAHEAKTPLSLLTLLLDNRREELSENVSCKLDYIQNRLQESVDQMLFYARLKGSRKDYLFEHISVRGCVEEVLEDYKPLLEEKQFQIQADMTEQTVCSDRRGLRFLLRQVISNSIKYCGKEPELIFTFFKENDCHVLSIRDNGIIIISEMEVDDLIRVTLTNEILKRISKIDENRFSLSTIDLPPVTKNRLKKNSKKKSSYKSS